MPTVVDICNAALSHCGTRSKINDINEGSPESIACLNHFNMVRDAKVVLVGESRHAARNLRVDRRRL